MDEATKTYMETLELSLIEKPDENNNNINPILYVEVYEGKHEVSGKPTVDNSSITPSEAVDLYGTERQPAPIVGQPAPIVGQPTLAFDDNSS